MPERSELILKIVCLGLGALLLWQTASLAFRSSPLAQLNIPELPALPAAEGQAGGKGTNVTPGQVVVKKGSNSVAMQGLTNGGTNLPSTQDSGSKGTNTPPLQASIKSETNAVLRPEAGKPDTNVVLAQALKKGETNPVAISETGKKGTNAVMTQAPGKPGPRMGPRAAPGNKVTDFLPIIQARIDKIYQSEILGPAMRPLPMALLGIAGKDVFLRTASGQTGLVKEGDDLGGVKLLRIGTNRVLVMVEGQQKELTIFSGLGGESLLPKQKEPTNETITKSK